MKKFYKISLIVAAIFALVGVGGIAVGISMGGSLQDYNQIGVYYDGEGIELYPEYREIDDYYEDKFEDWGDKIENKVDNLFDFDDKFDE